MKLKSFFRHHILGIAMVLLVMIGVWFVVSRYRTPGSMTVLQAQQMSAAQTAAASATPVAVEAARNSEFAPSVTYTGSVVALNDEQVYPRVTGRLVALYVYPGDAVRAGQVIGRLDSIELSSREQEAAAGRRAAESEEGMSWQERRAAVAQRRSAEAKAQGLRNAVSEAESQKAGAQAMREGAEEERSAAQASLADAEANISAMQANVEYWDRQIAREEALLKGGAISGEEYQRDKAQATTARAQLTQARAAVREKYAMVKAAGTKVRQAQAAIRGADAHIRQTSSDFKGALADASAAAAGIDLNTLHARHRVAQLEQALAQERTAGIVRDYTVLKAADDGTVTERMVSPGTLVQPGMAIVRIQKTDPIRLQANVSATDLTGIRVGSRVSVSTLQGSVTGFATRVTSIFSAANPQSRTVTVEALTPNADHRFIPGQYIAMRIATAPSRRAITVPVTAVARDDNQRPFVWTAARGASGQTAHRQYVHLGASDGRRVLVESGLPAGTQVIYRGQEGLNEGAAVTATAWGAAGPVQLPPPSGAAPGMPGMPGMSQSRSRGPSSGAPSPNQPGPPPSRPRNTPARPGSPGGMGDMPGM